MKLLLILLLLSLNCTAQRQNLILYQSFDTVIGNWYENNMLKSYSATISNYTARQGKSLKVELRKGEGYRAEFGTDSRVSIKEGWFGFSLFFPSSYMKDLSPESIVQFQCRPDFEIGEGWDRSAVLFIGVLNDRLILEIRSDSNTVTHIGKTTFERIDLGIVTKSKWTDFVFHINWSYKDDGLVELWKNDKLVLSKKGANCYNDKLNPYFKCGIYKWDWAGNSNSTTTARTMYIDEVRIGNERATYNDVYPYRKVVKIIKYYNDGSAETSNQ